ncbi:PAS domain S-box protein [Pseudomonas sp. XK-1]|uniref:PAS domain S-box protein n=1 Tax=Pseudomonas sp. XK-1 TaxID=3136019 RepID=UPI0031198972
MQPEESRSTVLMICESSVLSLRLNDVLQQRNYNIATAKNGATGTDIAQRLHLDLILLDWNLGNGHGLEVCSQLKKMQNTRAIPVVFFGIAVTSQDIARGLLAGGVDFLLESLPPEEMLTRLMLPLETTGKQDSKQPHSDPSNNHLLLAHLITAQRDTLNDFNSRLNLKNQALSQMHEAVYLRETSSHSFTYVNHEACRSLGYSNDELLSMTFADIDPDWTEENSAEIKERLDLGYPVTLERRHHRKDNSSFPVVLTVSKFEHRGKFFILTLAKDATEQKQNERDLNMLQVAVDRFTDATYVLDSQARFRYANNAAIQTLEYSLEELLQLSFPEIVPDTNLEDTQLILKHVKDSTDHSYTIETQCKTRTGRTFPVSVTSTSFDYDGETLFINIAQDLTERKQAEYERLEHLKFFETMDRVNRVIHESNDIDTMSDNILDIILAAVEADRVYVLTLTDPTNNRFNMTSVRFRSEYPPPYAKGAPLEISPEMADFIRSQYLDGGEVIKFGTGGIPLPQHLANRYGYRSNMTVQMLPKGHHRMYLGVHQISSERVWLPAEERLIKEIGRRLTSGISTLLAHQELYASEQHYRTLAESLPDNIARFDLKSKAIYLNPSALTTLSNIGVDSTTTNKKPSEVSTRTYAQTLESWINTVIATSTSHQGEIRLNFTNNSERVFDVKIVPDRNAQGETIGALSIGRDITERVATEQTIRKLNADWEAILQTIPDLLFELDPEGRYLQVWTHSPELLADSADNLLGKKIMDVLDTEAATITMEALQEAALSGTSYGKVLRLLQHDGPHWFELSVARKAATNETLPHFIMLSRDISNRMIAEIELKESRAQLRMLASRREAAREEERCRIARELHDELGQQLSALRFGLTMLDFKFGSALSTLRESTAGLLELLEKTIQTTRNVSFSLRPAALDLGIIPALEWLVSDYSRHLKIDLELQGSPDELRLDNDVATAVFRIVQESLTNITRHSKASHVKIILNQANNCLIVEVQDNGIGFDAKIVGRQSFGLIGIRERCLALGGNVTIKSSHGKGTIISANIPLQAKLVRRET